MHYHTFPCNITLVHTLAGFERHDDNPSGDFLSEDSEDNDDNALGEVR